MLDIRNLDKTFTLHLQDGTELPVLNGASLTVEAGECVVLAGASGMGKSSLLKLAFGNYKAVAGQIMIEHEGHAVDLVSAEPQTILEVRRRTLGYVSQFLRCVPRKAARAIVAEPLIALGREPSDADRTAVALLARLNIPERLWDVPPATFSGGEQQRVNIARGFAHPFPVLLLDEPTASLDAENRAVVVELIDEAKARGAALLGIFHDQDVREAVADRLIDIRTMRTAA